MKFRIKNQQQEMAVIEAKTAMDAVNAFITDAGYDSVDDMADALGITHDELLLSLYCENVE